MVQGGFEGGGGGGGGGQPLTWLTQITLMLLEVLSYFMERPATRLFFIQIAATASRLINDATPDLPSSRLFLENWKKAGFSIVIIILVKRI